MSAGDDYREAALAVEQTTPPAVRAMWADRSLGDSVTTAMVNDDGLPVVAAWWKASAQDVTAAVQHQTGLPEGDASVIVGATVHALRITGGDLTQFAVTERAVRAAFWHLGRRMGNAEASLMGPAASRESA